jgi:hypothetical protein
LTGLVTCFDKQNMSESYHFQVKASGDLVHLVHSLKFVTATKQILG